MLRILDQSRSPGSMCDGLTRRDWLRIGALALGGITMPALLAGRKAQAAAGVAAPRGKSFGKAKSVIVLFLLGGPPQHETWDPKPDAPIEIRGDLKPIKSKLSGLDVGELMPLTAKHTDKVSVLRACRTADNAHSTSGYAMTTGDLHVPLGVENASPGAPNNRPSFGSIIRHLVPSRGPLPSAVTVPEVLANDGNKTWPGQDAGFLGRGADPWVLQGDPSAKNFEVPDVTLPGDMPGDRFDARRTLLRRLDHRFAAVERGGTIERFDAWQQQAFDLLRSPKARHAFDLTKETDAMRDRYGRTKFGQSVLLARRLVEAGVSLVQVSWTRIDGALNNGHWDTHGKNSEALKTALMPRMDQAYSALLEDLSERGMLDETLVVWMGEFGRTPKINGAGGRDHWGNVFSMALAGGGVKRGYVHGESDRIGAEPKSGVVSPPDFTATLYHCLGIDPLTEIHDTAGRPHPISRGNVIQEIL